MGTGYDVMRSRLSHFGGKCYQTANKTRSVNHYIRGIKSGRYFNPIFISLLSTKYRVSHQQSPDIVQERSTYKFNVFLNRCACNVHARTLVDFQKWFQSVSSNFRYQVDPFCLGHILKHLVLFWCYDNDIWRHDCHGNKRIWPQIHHFTWCTSYIKITSAWWGV